MEERGLGVFEFLGDVASETEIWVLVDSAGDQTGDIGDFAKYVRERVGERRCGLDGCEVDLSNVIAANIIEDFELGLLEERL